MASKADLQAQALDLGLELVDEKGKELTKAQLQKAIDEAAEAEEPEEEEAEEVAPEPEPEPEPVKAKPAGPAAGVLNSERHTGNRARVRASQQRQGEPSKADVALAAEYGWPQPITGGKAYRAKVGMRCGFTGRFAEPGEVVILNDAHAKHKQAHIEALA